MQRRHIPMYKTEELIERLSQEHSLSLGEYAFLIKERTPAAAEKLASLADRAPGI